jgi:hypothetical protein
VLNPNFLHNGKIAKVLKKEYFMKIKQIVLKYGAPILALAGFAATAMTASADYNTSTLPSALGDVLNASVQVTISTVVAFLQNNLPIIVVLGVSISFVFWLLAKARRAGHGG